MSIADDIVREALNWVGTPYRHQGRSKAVGCDCLGLVRGVWLSVYGAEPEQPGPYAPDWAECATGEPLLEAARRHCVEKPAGEARAGDLIAFRWRAHHAAKHLGILTGEGTFVHAYEGHRVMVSALVPQWRRRIAGAFAFPPRDRDLVR